MKTLKVLLQEVVSGIKAWVNSNFAQESNTVHKTGNETITGNKTFSGGIYSSNYYYNGVVWGLARNNTWTGANTFASVLKQKINSVYSQTPATDRFAVHEFLGTDSNRIFALNCADRSSGQREISLLLYDTDGSFKASGLCKESDNSYSFRSRNNNDINLGTSTYRWKTLNGVNPGALSFPDFSAEYNVSGEIVPPEGENAININGGDNYFTPTVSGWLSVRMHYATAISICRSTRSSYRVLTVNPSEGDMGVCSPVVAGETYKIRIWASKWDDSGNNYDHFRLAPCLGNV